jgi:hypothetical protein
MIKRLALCVGLSALLVTGLARAQEPDATPTPDPMEYNDAAMHFRAPDAFKPLGQRQVTLESLNSDDPTVLAGWVEPGNDIRIIIQAQRFTGNVGDFSDKLQEELKSRLEDALVKNTENTKLRNGMPAVFIEISAGSGFGTEKIFGYGWADGRRGMALLVVAPLGAIDESSVKRYLYNASAVAYPMDR